MYHPDTIIQAQRNLELAGLEDGANRYYNREDLKARAEGFERRADVRKMSADALPILTAAIGRWVDEAKAKKGRPAAALAPLKEVAADKLALAALSRTFHTVAKGEALSTTSEAIGKAVQVEIEAQMIEETDPKAAKRFLAMVEGESNERVTAKRHKALADDLGVGLEWSRRTQVLVGSTLLNLTLTSLPTIFERGMVHDHRGTTPVVKLSEEALETLADMAAQVAWMQPILKPMIVTPRPWTRFDSGAYLEHRVSKTVPLIRTFNREHQQLVRDAIKDGSMSELLLGINAIQETPFAIDRRVFDVMRWVRSENKSPSKTFAVADPIAKPEKMGQEEWDQLSPEARVAMSRKRRSIINIRTAAQTNLVVLETDLGEAERLLDVDRFYLPHSLDFRGRVYAVPHFNPQRSDHIKALFRFADTHPHGAEGGRWLAIHLANCGDFKTTSGRKCSKASFDERCAWVDENEEMILGIAADPQGTFDQWAQADSPFCFLQACFEWAEFAATGYDESFEGCVGVALDGSCSGLQHYSAMTRAADEGYHVNLLPRETPGDIYQVTADNATPMLQALTLRDDDIGVAAGLVLTNGFGRGETKRNVMTYFYGSGKFGMRDQHMSDLMRPLADEVALGEREAHPYAMQTVRKNKETGEETTALDGGFTCAQVLANTVYAAIVTVAPKADEAANWFQQVAATLAHESLPVIWRTPTGLPVVQRYNEYTTKQVSLWLYARGIQAATGHDKVDADGNVMTEVKVLIREAPTKRIDKKKARSAISPNVIHSLDAAHLTRTVVFAVSEGIGSFQLIHDSFATHAGNTGRFFRIIREAFVNLYETYDPFVELDRYARSVLSEEGQEKLPAIPAKGTLDLSHILTSPYAFA
ncbi:DNA-directed RNA polymerase [Sphingomonas sp. BK580]|uniref:DNA-directed RNA polymerase n=1 Tax=Sphingomonas sp. BK580 TaxID=2586972 RepID=UPI0016182C13|nr:DNA-directed RNA polymerase [Sphingomonas sp. BK580]MBB3693054.1 DNA-directed RNA polymerase [Sphingomonas sp. BK580]